MSKKENINAKNDVEEFFEDENEKEINEKKESEIDEKLKQENIEKMLQDITDKKKMPKDVLGKIYSTIFVNVIIAILIMAYLFFIILGAKNIGKNIYETDLKVFTGGLFAISIFLIELAYKKSNKTIAIHSIEILTLTMCHLFFGYFYTNFLKEYKLIIGGISLIFGSYYIIKSIVVFIVMKNKYFKNMSDVEEILNKDFTKEDE